MTDTECINERCEALARRFHETYERLAPQFGYETRAETREFDPNSPNGRLMIAVCAELSVDECGNWREIVKESEHLLDKRFRGRDGEEYTFFGIVHGSDDYYYGMWRKGHLSLLSCVGNFEGHGFELVKEEPA